MTTPPLTEVQLLKSREAARVLDVSPRQLDRLVEAGVVRPVRLTPNGNRRFRVADLVALATNKEEED